MSIFLPGKYQGQRSLVGSSPSGFEEWEMTEPVYTGKRVGKVLQGQESSLPST